MRRLRLAGLLTVCLACFVEPAGAREEKPQRWEVTFAIRLTGGTGKKIDARLALPSENEARAVSGLEVTARGLKAIVARHGSDPHVKLEGKLKGSRRVAVSYELTSRSAPIEVPPIAPLAIPRTELIPYLTPTRVLQSRSILVREFLETYVAPVIDSASPDLGRVIYEQTRERLTWQSGKKTLPLDVIRQSGGQRIGIERAFVTFLRCARIPARFVEGINLESSTRRKRVFWTEVWSAGHWWPMSASRGWYGTVPTRYVALTRDGAPVLSADEPLEAAYGVHTNRLREDP